MAQDNPSRHSDDGKNQTKQTTKLKPLRLWPGVLIVVLMLLGQYVVPTILPDYAEIGIFSGLIGGVLILLWWAFFSRAPHLDRWGAILLIVIALYATSTILNESISTGMMGMMFPMFAIPALGIAFVAWAVISRYFSQTVQRISMVLTILIACGFWALLQTSGITGDVDSAFSWRWSPTAEQQLLALDTEKPQLQQDSSAIDTTIIQWSGFRGPSRDGKVPHTQITTDWSVSPPEELWRRPIGPAWSSFAVQNNLLYTQEQRGEEEAVSCYDVVTGKPVWRHSDPARFWESNAGAGPRGTPTLHAGRLYSLGGTGILNALDAGNGKVIWSRNAAEDTKAKLPGWGFSSSPLVVDDLVLVATSGALVAYDIDTGSPRWFGPAGGEGYSSPHLVTIHNIQQVLQLTGDGIFSINPADGALLWEHKWGGYPIVQPAITPDGDILISMDARSGTRRLSAELGGDGWTVEERWTSNQLKPYFNDFAIHGDHAYGFDGRILACIGLEDGKRKWKGGRYGNGQMVLLTKQNLMVVLSEKGELALVSAIPDQFTELGRMKAIEGKTWNHPVLIDDILLVRNGQEMVAFKLALVSS